ncbi:MAG: hypothetical protein IT428_19355 [Planctomycetaceae bacterium]|nr:hypothetical protein [Planctomycetaceae bacterium]
MPRLSGAGPRLPEHKYQGEGAYHGYAAGTPTTDGELYFVSQHKGTYVVAAKPKFELLAHNVFEEDDSRANASPAISHGRLLLRTDRRLYCIGTK